MFIDKLKLPARIIYKKRHGYHIIELLTGEQWDLERNGYTDMDYRQLEIRIYKDSAVGYGYG